MERIIINTTADINGARHQYKIMHNTASDSVPYTVFEDDVAVDTERSENDAREFVEMSIKMHRCHMEDIIRQNDRSSFGIAFERNEDETITLKTVEWKNDRYNVIDELVCGPEFLQEMYGYC